MQAELQKKMSPHEPSPCTYTLDERIQKHADKKQFSPTENRNSEEQAQSWTDDKFQTWATKWDGNEKCYSVEAWQVASQIGPVEEIIDVDNGDGAHPAQPQPKQPCALHANDARRVLSLRAPRVGIRLGTGGGSNPHQARSPWADLAKRALGLLPSPFDNAAEIGTGRPKNRLTVQPVPGDVRGLYLTMKSMQELANQKRAQQTPWTQAAKMVCAGWSLKTKVPASPSI